MKYVTFRDRIWKVRQILSTYASAIQWSNNHNVHAVTTCQFCSLFCMNTTTPILVEPAVANCCSLFPVSLLWPQVLRPRVKCMFNIQAKHITMWSCSSGVLPYDQAPTNAFEESLSFVILKHRADYFVEASQTCLHGACAVQTSLCSYCGGAVTQLVCDNNILYFYRLLFV